jgi:hypothetical protein
MLWQFILAFDLICFEHQYSIYVRGFEVVPVCLIPIDTWFWIHDLA